MLPVDGSVLHQPVLLLDVTVLQQPCAACGRICSTSACPAHERVCCLVASAVPSGDCPKMYGRQGFFHFVSKQICLFRLFRYRFETPKQTETNRKSYFWFHETNRKTIKTYCASVLFSSNRKKNSFLIRGHPSTNQGTATKRSIVRHRPGPE